MSGRAIQRWLNGPVALAKPEVLSARGRMTVADLLVADSFDGYARLVRDWAGSVWAAYAPQREIARAWIKAAMGGIR